MSRFLCVVLAAALAYVWFFKEVQIPEVKVVEKPILVPAAPLVPRQDRPSRIIVGDANGGQDRVIWERSR